MSDLHKRTSSGTTRRCTSCNAVVREGAHAGLCPRCLLRAALVDEEPPSSVPMEFAGYELLEKLGEGGMGVVWKARPLESIERVVALKRIRDGEFAENSLLCRFSLEIKAIAELRHPHIVPFLDIGEYEGEPYFTMEFLPGGNLAQNAARYAEPTRAAQLMAKVARAVHAGHEKRILHRDLKPANILFDASDEPRLTDFGLAKRLDIMAGSTTTGVLLGTAFYLPPERASGQANRDTVAADIWSLGVIFYELIAGRRPFSGRTTIEVIRRIIDADPEPLERLRGGADQDIEKICQRCLQKSPVRRYAMAKTLAEDLETYVQKSSR